MAGSKAWTKSCLFGENLNDKRQGMRQILHQRQKFINCAGFFLFFLTTSLVSINNEFNYAFFKLFERVVAVMSLPFPLECSLRIYYYYINPLFFVIEYFKNY